MIGLGNVLRGVSQDRPVSVFSSEPPIIDGDLHSNRIEPLGGNAILNCEVRGDPLPTIQWSKNGINMQISNRIRQLDNGSLAIYGTVVGEGHSPSAVLFLVFMSHECVDMK